MKKLLFLSSLLSFLFHTIIQAQTVNFLGGNICPTESWKLVFQDEFTGSSLDQSKWITYYPYGPNGSDQCEFCRTHGNGESQIYKDNNVVVGSDVLKLIAKNEYSSWYSAQRNYTSGMIHSKSNFSFMY